MTTLEASDGDEGAYGQVIYQLQQMDTKEQLFAVGTSMGKAIVRLVGEILRETIKLELHQRFV